MIQTKRGHFGMMLGLVVVAGLAVPVGSVSGQTAGAPVLKGPTVTERNVPGADDKFGMGMGDRRGERVPPEVFRRAIAVILDENAAAKLRATPEQREEIRKLVDGFEESVRKYRRQHAKEIAELREAAGEIARERNAGEMRTDGADLSSEELKKREEAKAKLRELQGAGPKIESVYTKVWTDLSEPQRVAVEKVLDGWRAEQAKRREDAYVRRQTAARDKDGKVVRPNAEAAKREAAMREGGGRGANDEMMRMAPKEEARVGEAERARRQAAIKEGENTENSRRDRLVRLFRQMSPEEQEQLLERLEERARTRRRPNAAATGDKSKPPADVDQVKVPAPQEGTD